MLGVYQDSTVGSYSPLWAYIKKSTYSCSHITNNDAHKFSTMSSQWRSLYNDRQIDEQSAFMIFTQKRLSVYLIICASPCILIFFYCCSSGFSQQYLISVLFYQVIYDYLVSLNICMPTLLWRYSLETLVKSYKWVLFLLSTSVRRGRIKQWYK